MLIRFLIIKSPQATIMIRNKNIWMEGERNFLPGCPGGFSRASQLPCKLERRWWPPTCILILRSFTNDGIFLTVLYLSTYFLVTLKSSRNLWSVLKKKSVQKYTVFFCNFEITNQAEGMKLPLSIRGVFCL